MNNLKIDKVPLKNIYETTYSIPIYQREYVWKKRNQVNLIESILNDYPIGAILVFRSDKRDNLIDGLQRVTTLQRFSSNPKNIFKNAKAYTDLPIVDSKISEIKEGLHWINIENYERCSDAIDKIYNEWFNSLDKRDKSQDNLLSFLENKELKKVIKLYKLINKDVIEIFEKFYSTIDISYYLLPVMYYDGNDADLPQIFENLNTNSISLGKYDVYNSTWVDILVTYTDDQIETITEINNEKNTELDDEKIGLEGFTGNDGPIINEFKLLHRQMVAIYREQSSTKPPKSLYNLSFEIYSSLYSGDYNDIKSLVALLSKNFKLKDENAERKKVNEFFKTMNCMIIQEYEYCLSKYGVNILKLKNRFLYLVMTRIHKNNNIDFISLDAKARSESERKQIKLQTYEEICEKKWFEAENRQLNFFKEKSEEFLNSVYSINKTDTNNLHINITPSGSLEYIEKLDVSNEEVSKIFSNEINYEYFEIQNVNNEPYNKRIQNIKEVKEALINKKSLVSLYKIASGKYIKIKWTLTIEEINSFIHGGNYSLKLNLQDFQHVYMEQLSDYENKYMKYKAKLSYVELED